MFVVVCSIWLVGWSVSGVCVGCEVSCGVHGIWCVFVFYKCGISVVCVQ